MVIMSSAETGEFFENFVSLKAGLNTYESYIPVHTLFECWCGKFHWLTEQILRWRLGRTSFTANSSSTHFLPVMNLIVYS